MKGLIEKDLASVRALLLRELSLDGYESIERLGGLTNHTYRVKAKNGREYVVRIPGEGTEQMIVRDDERTSTELACELGIDAELLYFGKDGAKITAYIKNAETMSKASIKEEKRLRQVADVLKRLHGCKRDTGVPFEVFEMAASYEKIMKDMHVPSFDDYEAVKARVLMIKQATDGEIPTRRVPCHNDPLCENWVVGDEKMYLIDWEYAGMNDGMWDVADVSIEAELSEQEDGLLLSAYLGREPSISDRRHFLASKLYVDFLWTLWAKARVPYDGQPMEDWASERYARLKENIKAYDAL